MNKTPKLSSYICTHFTESIINIVSNNSQVTLLSRPEHEIFSVIDANGMIVRPMQAYLSSMSQKVGLKFAQSTVMTYARILGYLCKWIDVQRPYTSLGAADTVLILTRTDVLWWLKSMGKLAGKTIRLREAVLKGFLDWLCTEEGGNLRKLDESPWGRGEIEIGYLSSTPTASTPKIITVEMICKLLNSFHNECERCMFHLQYDCGLRISELIALKPYELPTEELFDESHAFLPFQIQGVKGKGGKTKPRMTLISRAVLSRVRRYLNSAEYRFADKWDISGIAKPIFLTSTQRQWTERNASQQFKKAVRRSGLTDEISTHWMRHGTAFSVLISDAGKSIEDRMLIVQQMLGHTHLRTTEIYLQISPSLLTNLNIEAQKTNRLEEAETIRKLTYLAPLKHREKRGHNV